MSAPLWRPAAITCRYLDVWAACRWHWLAGADGYPDADALDEVPGAGPVGGPLRESAAQLYDATRDKYERGRAIRPDAWGSAEYLSVECWLDSIGDPPLVGGLLLHLHPSVGRFHADRELRAFRPAPGHGALASGYLDRALDGYLRQVYREACRSLSHALKAPLRASYARFA